MDSWEGNMYNLDSCDNLYVDSVLSFCRNHHSFYMKNQMINILHFITPYELYWIFFLFFCFNGLKCKTHSQLIVCKKQGAGQIRPAGYSWPTPVVMSLLNHAHREIIGVDLCPGRVTTGNRIPPLNGSMWRRAVHVPATIQCQTQAIWCFLQKLGLLFYFGMPPCWLGLRLTIWNRHSSLTK